MSANTSKLPSGRLSAVRVTKRIDLKTILDDVSVSFEEGTLTLLLGRNGAGKTSLLKALATLSSVTEGAVAYRGANVLDYGKAYRRELGLILDDSLLYPDLTARENLRFYARLYGVDHEQVEALLEAVGLRLFAHEHVSRFSRGMIQRLAVARSLIHQPSILLWDEPLTAIDAFYIPKIVRLLAERVQAGALAVVVTHDVSDFWDVADRIVFMRAGRIALDVKREELSPTEVAAWIQNEGGLSVVGRRG